MASCPHLYDSAWISAKGDLAAKDYNLAVKLEEPYGMIIVINNLLRTIEDLKWGVVGAMTNIEHRRELVLKHAKEIVGKSLLPELENARTLLEKKSKVLRPGWRKYHS